MWPLSWGSQVFSLGVLPVPGVSASGTESSCLDPRPDYSLIGCEPFVSSIQCVKLPDHTLDPSGGGCPDQAIPIPDRDMVWRGVPTGCPTFWIVVVVLVSVSRSLASTEGFPGPHLDPGLSLVFFLPQWRERNRDILCRRLRSYVFPWVGGHSRPDGRQREYTVDDLVSGFTLLFFVD